MAEGDWLSATPPGIRLGPLDLIPDGGSRNFVIELKAGRFHGFVVRQGDAVYGYVDRCPHMGMPLAHGLDDYLTEDSRLIECDWHGALFDVASGKCVGGPCVGAGLTKWAVAVIDAHIVTDYFSAPTLRE